MSSSEPKPEIEPMEVDDARIVAVGTALFAVAFVVLLAFRSSLDHAGHGRWPWVALSGVVLGLAGWTYCRRRARRLAATPNNA
jgi:hypothetical protein